MQRSESRSAPAVSPDLPLTASLLTDMAGGFFLVGGVLLFFDRAMFAFPPSFLDAANTTSAG